MASTDREPRRSAGPRLFRGTEFIRLLVLLGVLAIGWPLACQQIRSRARHLPEQKPTVPAAEIPPLPQPDRSKVFAAVEDKTPLNWRENAAYAELLTRARQAKADSLASKSRTDVYYSDLVARPARHRGIPIHIDGTARRVRVDQEVNKELTPKEKLYEAYVFTSESRNYPYILVFEDAPKNLAAGADLFQKVSFDGYFFKLLLYRDGNRDLRFAPMLVGRLAVPKSFEEVEAERSSFLSKVPWIAVAVVALVVYMLIRAFFSLRRLFFPARVPSSRKPRPTEIIEPEALAEWLAEAPDSASEPPRNGFNGSRSPRPDDRDPSPNA